MDMHPECEMAVIVASEAKQLDPYSRSYYAYRESNIERSPTIFINVFAWDC